MRARETSRRYYLTTLLVAVTLPWVSIGAQSKGKILTPPHPADTSGKSTAVTRPPAASGVSSPTPPGPARPPLVVPQSPVLDSIREVVFRNLLEHDRAGFATLAGAFCLSLSNDDFKKASTPDRADPPESMVKRLATPRTPARRASTCTFAPNGTAQRSVTGRSLLYVVGAIDFADPERAEAAAGYNYDGYSAGGYTFSVERADSGWVVKQWRLEWTANANKP